MENFEQKLRNILNTEKSSVEFTEDNSRFYTFVYPDKTICVDHYNDNTSQSCLVSYYNKSKSKFQMFEGTDNEMLNKLKELV